MHICRGHSGTVTCLALPGVQNRDHDPEGNEDSNSKYFTNFLFSGTLPRLKLRLKGWLGSDDGSILLWNLNPPSQMHHIHGKRKPSASRNALTQSPPNLSSTTVFPDTEISQIPLLPPPILPLAQLVEGRKSGRTHRLAFSLWIFHWSCLFLLDSSTSRRFHGAGAELYCLSTSPPGPFDRCVSPPRDTTSDSMNCDPSPTSMRSPLSSAQIQVVRPIAPSLLRSNFHGHGGPIWAVDYDKDSNQLFSGSYDQTIKVFYLPLLLFTQNGMTDLGCCHRTLSQNFERS